MEYKERELGNKVVELFEDFLQSNENDGYVDVAFSERYGFVVLVGFSEENASFEEAYAFTNSSDLFIQLLHEYKISCLIKCQQETGLDVDYDSLSEEQKNELHLKMDYYTSKWKKILEESTNVKSIEEVNKDYHDLVGKYALVK